MPAADHAALSERENAAIGALFTTQEPTRRMREEDAAAGFREAPDGSWHHHAQSRTIEEPLAGKGLEHPRRAESLSFQKAPRLRAGGHRQDRVGLVPRGEDEG